MKVLIFYSRTGGGHLRAAEAIASEIKKTPGNSVELIDGLSVTGTNKNLQPDKIFLRFSTSLLSIYNFIYAITDNKVGISIVRSIIKKVWGKAIKRTVETAQPDIILSTHPSLSPQTIPGTLSAPFITVCTDLGKPHFLWFDEKVTKLFVASDEISTYFSKKYPNAKNISVSGYPLKDAFSSANATRDITHHILILGGGSGTGNIADQTAILKQHFPEYTISVVCGVNETLRKKLEDKQYKNVHFFGFVDNLSELIKSADIVLTKAGPGAVIEAAVLKKPIVMTSWIVAQEKDNITFAENNKLGLYCPDYKKLPEAIKYVYDNYSKYGTLGGSIFEGSKNIVRYIESLRQN